MENKKVNSQQYWDERFSSGDWKMNLGKEQTRYFYSLLTKMLPQWLKMDIRKNKYSMIDFGCAEGQGMPLLVAELGDNIKGIDFSEYAIKNAVEEYPYFEFEVGDIWKYNVPVDVTIMSNIIEHFPNPFDLLSKVASFTQKYMIVMVPLEEKNLMKEHCFTFLYQNIPTVVDDFHLIHFNEYDCRKDEEHLFEAKQILLVYSKNAGNMNLLTLDQFDGLIELREHQVEEVVSKNLTNGANDKSDLLIQVLDDCKKTEAQLVQSVSALIDHSHELEKQHAENVSRLIESSTQNIEKGLNQVLHTQAIENRCKELETKDQEITRKNQQLIELYNDVERRYVELVERFNNLNDAYGLVVAENVKIKGSRTYRIALKESELLDKMHLKESARFLLDARIHGVKESIRQHKVAKEIKEFQSESVQIVDTISEDAGKKSESLSFMMTHKKVCENQLKSEWNELTKEINDILNHSNYKGIVVYPVAVNWEPMQRPQHFLRTLAAEGYLCFFCEWVAKENKIREIENNLYIINGEENILPVLQNRCPIVLVTYHKQTVFCDLLPQKVLWFDILDNLDFFDGANDEGVSQIYKKLIENADVVTYSADNLSQYVAARRDAIKVNNGVYLADFAVPEINTIGRLEKIKENGHKIIGYYGAIEEWFDINAVKYILDNTKHEVVLIGKRGINLEAINNQRLHLIDALPYNELKNYAQYFDVAIIPFIVNKLTNSVSPVKFYEYVAQKIPVVSSAIHEMKKYAGDLVKIYQNYEELVAAIEELCSSKCDRNSLFEIAKDNTWEKRVEKVHCELFKNVAGLKALADISNNGTVAVETVTFFKYDGTTYYSGGAERYLLDLDEICRELDIQYRVYQYAEYDWVRFYNNVEVIGLGAKKNDVNRYDCPLVNEMEESFARETNSGALNIYSPFYILNRKANIPSVGISHGISWDSEFNRFTDGNSFWQVNKNIIDAASYCDQMISVDTNTCNWFQTLDYNTGRKIKYIPNYVDNEEFSPRNDYLQEKDKVVITYPRRLYGARGLYVVLEVIDDVLSTFPNVEFHFVGKGFEVDTKHVEKKIQKWGDRVKWYSKSPDKMYEVYQYTDISLIPTMYSEGTSLSCLEALSSGNAVIATRVGGLTDLILSGYNGMLVEPNGDSIKQALFELLNDPEKLRTLKENAVLTARTFSKKQWKERWKNAIKSAVGERKTSLYNKAVRCRISLESIEDLKNNDVLDVIRERLEKGYYVFVACKNNPLKTNSYKRLQFINDDEDLYFTPEEKLCIKDI